MRLVREKLPDGRIKKHYFPKSSKEIRNLIIEHNPKLGWPVKWGGKWDIAYTDAEGDKIMIPTGLHALDLWSVEEWISFIKNIK